MMPFWGRRRNWNRAGDTTVKGGGRSAICSGYSAEVFPNVDFEECSLGVPSVDEDVRCATGTEPEAIPNLVIELSQVLVVLAAGQHEGHTARILSLLYSPSFDIEVTKTILKIVLDLKNICHKVGKSTTMNNGFTMKMINKRESLGSRSSVVIQLYIFRC